MNNRLMREGLLGGRGKDTSTAGSSGFLNKLVVIGVATGVAMLSFRAARLVVSSLVLGLKVGSTDRCKGRKKA